jgi:hypothetical protein
MKLKLINILIGLIVPILLKGSVIMKITFTEPSSIKDVELTPEDIKSIVEQIKSILELIDNNPRTANAITSFIAALSKAFGQ